MKRFRTASILSFSAALAAASIANAQDEPGGLFGLLLGGEERPAPAADAEPAAEPAPAPARTKEGPLSAPAEAAADVEPAVAAPDVPAEAPLPGEPAVAAPADEPKPAPAVAAPQAEPPGGEPAAAAPAGDDAPQGPAIAEPDVAPRNEEAVAAPAGEATPADATAEDDGTGDLVAPELAPSGAEPPAVARPEPGRAAGSESIAAPSADGPALGESAAKPSLAAPESPVGEEALGRDEPATAGDAPAERVPATGAEDVALPAAPLERPADRQSSPKPPLLEPPSEELASRREPPAPGFEAPGSVALPETEIQGELEKPDIFFLLPKARDQSDDQMIRARIRREITRPLVKEWLEEMMLLK